MNEKPVSLFEVMYRNKGLNDKIPNIFFLLQHGH